MQGEDPVVGGPRRPESAPFPGDRPDPTSATGCWPALPCGKTCSRHHYRHRAGQGTL